MGGTWHAAASAITAAFTGLLECDVFDGAPRTADELPAAFFVGWQANATLDSASGTFVQRPHDAGLPAAREEDGEVRCTLIVQGGDLEVEPVRARAFTHLEQIVSVLQRVPTAGQGTRQAQAANRLLDTWGRHCSAQLLNIGITSAVVTQGHTGRGVYAQLDFAITYQALITVA